MSETTKTDLRLHAYADVDEANAAIGTAIALGGLDEDVATLLTRIQNDLFDVGADFCTPVVAEPAYPPLRIEQEYVDRLEAWCDQYNEDLEPAFVHPQRRYAGRGAPARGAHGHPARGTRSLGGLRVHDETMNALAIKYLNRLSDLLFILARHPPGERRRALDARRRTRKRPRPESGGRRWPGGAASSHARKPVNASGLIAASTGPDGVLQDTTWPE